jgi:hypothetical protein
VSNASASHDLVGGTEPALVTRLDDAEEARLRDTRQHGTPWKKWGPYLSERQWGTVREDYSETGNAWSYFTHDQARSRAYRWGEDGLAGICDDRQILCFAPALWNGRDPILKERLFGLTKDEGNHGEDVKEYYFYLDSTWSWSEKAAPTPTMRQCGPQSVERVSPGAWKPLLSLPPPRAHSLHGQRNQPGSRSLEAETE